MAGSFSPLVEISISVLGGALLPSCVLYLFFLVCIMVVPFANRAAVASLPALALASKPASIKEVIEDFAKQSPHDFVLECVQLIKGRALRVVFPSTDVMKDMISGGLTFRDHPVQYKAPSVYKWVTVLDLPYSIPEGEIKTVLSAIPSRIVVAGHPCTICYRGQVRSCFRCSQTGHEAKTCPQKTAALSRPTATISIVPPAAPSGTVVFTASPTSPRTFASVLSGQVVPTVIDTLSSTPSSPFPKEVLLLPLGPVDETAHGVSEMDTGSSPRNNPILQFLIRSGQIPTLASVRDLASMSNLLSRQQSWITTSETVPHLDLQQRAMTVHRSAPGSQRLLMRLSLTLLLPNRQS